MDRYYSSAISKESSDIYSIPNSTQHDARQRCPALIVLKEVVRLKILCSCFHEILRIGRS